MFYFAENIEETEDQETNYAIETEVQEADDGKKTEEVPQGDDTSRVS